MTIEALMRRVLATAPDRVIVLNEAELDELARDAASEQRDGRTLAANWFGNILGAQLLEAIEDARTKGEGQFDNFRLLGVG